MIKHRRPRLLSLFFLLGVVIIPLRTCQAAFRQQLSPFIHQQQRVLWRLLDPASVATSTTTTSRSRNSIHRLNVAFVPKEVPKPNRRQDKNKNAVATTRTTTTLRPWQSKLTKLIMQVYIASMCLALPITLFPLWVIRKLRIVSKKRSEHLALELTEFCARTLLRLFPFVRLNLTPYHEDNPKPSIWVANHVSPIDTFLLLATDRRLRGGRTKRPIKSVYWQGLDNNPITKLVFHMAGFIPIQMADNGNGNPNIYDKKSFKTCLRQIKQAFNDGFDILILPEGQLNPTPDKGLQPVFSGAYHIAKMSSGHGQRPIRFLAIHGSHKLWHANHGMGQVTGRNVSIKIYPPLRQFDNADDFVKTFETIVGQFGTNGTDLPDNNETLATSV